MATLLYSQPFHTISTHISSLKQGLSHLSATGTRTFSLAFGRRRPSRSLLASFSYYVVWIIVTCDDRSLSKIKLSFCHWYSTPTSSRSEKKVLMSDVGILGMAGVLFWWAWNSDFIWLVFSLNWVPMSPKYINHIFVHLICTANHIFSSRPFQTSTHGQLRVLQYVAISNSTEPKAKHAGFASVFALYLAPLMARHHRSGTTVSQVGQLKNWKRIWRSFDGDQQWPFRSQTAGWFCTPGCSTPTLTSRTMTRTLVTLVALVEDEELCLYVLPVTCLQTRLRRESGCCRYL